MSNITNAIEISIGTPTQLNSRISGNEKINFSVATSGMISLPDYEGDYVFIPSVNPQEIECKNKAMRENISISSIPTSDVDNLSGGRTFTIG